MHLAVADGNPSRGDIGVQFGLPGLLVHAAWPHHDGVNAGQQPLDVLRGFGPDVDLAVVAAATAAAAAATTTTAAGANGWRLPRRTR
jgi:hypothetical protein